MKKKKVQGGSRRLQDWGPEKGAFLGASKGRTNWRQTAFSPCEAELKSHPGGPLRTPPG